MDKKKAANIAIFIVLGTFAFIFMKDCNEPPKAPKENAGDYYVSEYFKAEIQSPFVSKEELIKLASKERLKHYDKEGGIIKFKKDSSVWAYVEYHFPAAPERENAKDEFNQPVEVKIIYTDEGF